MYFYPRSPCGERLINQDFSDFLILISIHALLAESDTISERVRQIIAHFYPRSPCGERPREVFNAVAVPIHFYPRSPCGERRQTVLPFHRIPPFLSTLSLRRATYQLEMTNYTICISIHALLAESDSKIAGHIGLHSRISIHALLAESDLQALQVRQGQRISIHALLAESDDIRSTVCSVISISIHALLAESDVMHALILADAMLFLSTLSLRRATPRGGKLLS